MGLAYFLRASQNTIGEKEIRILIANPTRALRDFLYEAIRKAPDIEVVGEVSDESAVLAAGGHTRPDVVLLPMGDPADLTRLCKQILAADPARKILAIGEGSDLIALCRWSEGDIRITYMEATLEKFLKALGSRVS